MSTEGRSEPRVELFTTGPDCGLCERAWGHLLGLRARLRVAPEKVQLEADTPVPADYVIRAPVIHVDGRGVIEGLIEAPALEAALREAGIPPR